MSINKKSFTCFEQLALHLEQHIPTLFVASKTSTVIAYDQLETHSSGFCLGDLSGMPKNLSLDAEGILQVLGPVTWKEARAFCRSKNRDIMTAPTEELATVLAGLATSATGERCFGFGTLRDQVSKIKYLDYNGQEQLLQHENDVLGLLEKQAKVECRQILNQYQQTYRPYLAFKNAPFPRLLKETDLLIGTEGQLGVITQAQIKTLEMTDVSFVFILLPKWEEDYSLHLKIFSCVQTKRENIFSCELLDDNSLNVLPGQRPGKRGQDLIFLEMPSQQLPSIMSQILDQIPQLDESNIFEISGNKCHQLRMQVPRATFEANAAAGVVKMGTDVQVRPDKIGQLLDLYREFARLGIGYNLFGHFGDAHLHFNFLPTSEQLPFCQLKFEKFYSQVFDLHGSPFAEHGVGFIKQKFIKKFYNLWQYNMFEILKNSFDPHHQFFPGGFMHLKATL